MRNLRRYQDPLNQYMYLVDLLDRNEKLFYKLLSENTMELMPIVYTPTVGLACQKLGLAFKRPQVRGGGRWGGRGIRVWRVWWV